MKLEGHRVYVGSRTQRLVSPASSLGTTAGEPRQPIRITADGFEEKNFIVGEDFPVPVAKVTPPPVAVPFPTEKGNVKVATDLFVKGEIYKFDLRQSINGCAQGAPAAVRSGRSAQAPFVCSNATPGALHSR